MTVWSDSSRSCRRRQRLSAPHRQASRPARGELDRPPVGGAARPRRRRRTTRAPAALSAARTSRAAGCARRMANHASVIHAGFHHGKTMPLEVSSLTVDRERQLGRQNHGCGAAEVLRHAAGSREGGGESCVLAREPRQHRAGSALSASPRPASSDKSHGNTTGQEQPSARLRNQGHGGRLEHGRLRNAIGTVIDGLQRPGKVAE